MAPRGARRVGSIASFFLKKNYYFLGGWPPGEPGASGPLLVFVCVWCVNVCVSVGVREREGGREGGGGRERERERERERKREREKEREREREEPERD